MASPNRQRGGRSLRGDRRRFPARTEVRCGTPRRGREQARSGPPESPPTTALARAQTGRRTRSSAPPASWRDSERPGRASPQARLDAALAELKELEFIFETAYVPEFSYAFKHTLTGEVAYATLLHERRRVLHRAVARSMEDLYASRLADPRHTLFRTVPPRAALPAPLDPVPERPVPTARYAFRGFVPPPGHGQRPPAGPRGERGRRAKRRRPTSRVALQAHA